MHGLSVLEQRDPTGRMADSPYRRARTCATGPHRRRRIRSPISRFFTACCNAKPNRPDGPAGRASANGIHDHHDGAARCQQFIEASGVRVSSTPKRVNSARIRSNEIVQDMPRLILTAGGTLPRVQLAGAKKQKPSFLRAFAHFPDGAGQKAKFPIERATTSVITIMLVFVNVQHARYPI